MARKKQIVDETFDDNGDSFYAELAKQHEGSVLDDLSGSKYFVDTGNLAINYICSGRFIDGGIPSGQITEILGPSAGSKSLLSTCILHGAQKMGADAIYLDCERSINRDFVVRAAHVNPKRLLVVEPCTIEESFLYIHNLIRSIREKRGPDTPIVFVYDSIGATPCEREFKETGLPRNYTKAQFDKIVGRHEQPGERARISGNELRKINPVLSRENATLVVINQVRTKLNVMFGSPETGAGGGRALEFFGSCKLRVSPMKKIVKEITKDLKVPLGVNVKVENKKGRSFDPFWDTNNIQLYFKSGINPLGGLLGILIKAERVIPVGTGNYLVAEKYSGGKEEKFKGSMERNDVDPELLIRCPALIGAKDEEEVRNYLSTFGDAITIGLSESVVEEDDTGSAEEEE